MKEKNTQEFGEVQEGITLTLEYNIRKRDQSLLTEGKMTKTVSLKWGSFSCGDGMSIGQIVDFQEKANALLEEIKNLLLEGTYMTVSVTKSAYEHVPEYEIVDEFGSHTSTLKTLQFERWEFKDNTLSEDPDEEGAGLYLSPDTKYTEATWDMILYWKQDILKSLAEAHL